MVLNIKNKKEIMKFTNIMKIVCPIILLTLSLISIQVSAAEDQKSAPVRPALIERFQAVDFRYMAGVGQPSPWLSGWIEKRFAVDTSLIKGLWVITTGGETPLDLEREGRLHIINGPLDMYQIEPRPAGFLEKLRRGLDKISKISRGMGEMTIYTQDPAGRATGTTRAGSSPGGKAGGEGGGCGEGEKAPTKPTGSGGGSVSAGDRMTWSMAGGAGGNERTDEELQEGDAKPAWTDEEGNGYVDSETGEARGYDKEGKLNYYSDSPDRARGVQHGEGEKSVAVLDYSDSPSVYISPQKKPEEKPEEKPDKKPADDTAPDTADDTDTTGGATDISCAAEDPNCGKRVRYCTGPTDTHCIDRPLQPIHGEPKAGELWGIKSKTPIGTKPYDPRVDRGARPPGESGGLFNGRPRGCEYAISEECAGTFDSMVYDPCMGNLFTLEGFIAARSRCAVSNGGRGCPQGWEMKADFSKGAEKLDVESKVKARSDSFSKPAQQAPVNISPQLK